MAVRRRKRGQGGSGRGLVRGVRLVALLEAAKGAAVVLVGCGLLALIHRDVQGVAEEVVRHLHINPAHRYPRIFLDLAGRATDGRLWVMALTALLYAVIRFAEAYGLWRRREWALWFGILSGGVYLPVEGYELLTAPSLLKGAVTAANLFIVAWLCWYRWRGRGA